MLFVQVEVQSALATCQQSSLANLRAQQAMATCSSLLQRYFSHADQHCELVDGPTRTLVLFGKGKVSDFMAGLHGQTLLERSKTCPKLQHALNVAVAAKYSLRSGCVFQVGP